MKLVVNRCEGDGVLEMSKLAEIKLLELKEGKPIYAYSYSTVGALSTGDDTIVNIIDDISTVDSLPFMTSVCLSKDYYEKPIKRRDLNLIKIDIYDLERTDQDFIKVVEELGDDASTKYSCLEVFEIPDDIDYELYTINGFELIVEKEHYW